MKGMVIIMIYVYIDGEEIAIDTRRDSLGWGVNGDSYRGLLRDRLLSVKLYHSDEEYMKNYRYYPEEETLSKFIELAPSVKPILLSQFLVTDEDGNYIGCARDYIEPTQSNTTEALFSMPKEQALQYFYAIEEKIPIFAQNDISLFDWHKDNAMLGSVQQGTEQLYVFDDTGYEWHATKKKNNFIELRRLIESFVDDFLLQHHIDGYIRDIIQQDIYAHHHPISFLEDISGQEDSLENGIIQYTKKLNDRALFYKNT